MAPKTCNCVVFGERWLYVYHV